MTAPHRQGPQRGRRDTFMTGRPYVKLNEYGGKADSLVRKSIVNLAPVSGNRLGRKYTSGLQLCEPVSKDVGCESFGTIQEITKCTVAT